MKPTKDIYDQLDRAYNYFNQTLFNQKLPPCILLLHRKRNAYGYFWGNTWQEREGQSVTDEIALNPETFKSRSLEKVLSTLVHEMCHLQQHHFGKPSPYGYHNKEWAQMMEAVGLIPTNSGKLGGKQTGYRVTHVIETNGLFEKVCAKLICEGFRIPWQAVTGNKEEIEKRKELAKKKAASKTKYSCSKCKSNAWAKPNTKLICGRCEEPMLTEV